QHVAALLLEHCSRLDDAKGGFPDALRAHGKSDDGQRRDGQAPAAALRKQTALPAAVAGRVDRLGGAAAPPSKAPERLKPNQRQLRYILNHHDALHIDGSAAAWLRPVSVRLRKDGCIYDERRYDPNSASRPKEQRPRFLTDDHLAILSDL